MSEEAAPDPPPAKEDLSPPSTPRRRRRWSWRLLAWLGELATVFVGVFAAFLLSNYVAHRHERQRRDQILAWIDGTYSETLANSRVQVPLAHQTGQEFHRRLDAGEMPAIVPFRWRADYDPSDSNSVLQSGGYELLDIETVRDLRDVESTLRILIATLQRTQRLSDDLILPNLGKGSAVFYDPDTRQLREPYAWYPKIFEEEADLFEEAQPKIEKLLAQTRAERARRR